MMNAETGTIGASALRGTWIDGEDAARLHARAGAARWGLSVDRFHEALERVLEKRFGAARPDATIVRRFLDSLHLEDLALARACAEGRDVAWEAFVDRHWRDACRAARAIAGETDGEEIADALLADLFARGDGAARRPLFDYFHGRSKLVTWLRALLAQRHVDRLRATRRLSPFEVDEDGEARPAPVEPVDPDRARLVAAFMAALDGALAALAERDRLRLAYYHGDGLTLAAIGRLLGEHEATVSRKLQRTRDALRESVDAELRRELQLDGAQLHQCYQYAIEAGGLDLARLRGAETGKAGLPSQERQP